MQCDRLIRMIKSWYTHVREETMAPARMVSFMEQHIGSCSVCRQDPDLKDEVAKITELVLPESKIPKAIRQQEDGFEDIELDSDDTDEVTDDQGLDEELDEEVDEVIDDELGDDDEVLLDDEEI
jgi:hypothetical protein